MKEFSFCKRKLHPKKTSSVLSLLVTLLFLVIGVLMILDNEGEGWFVAIVFGFGFLISVVNLLPKASYLLLDEEGFETCSLFRKHKYHWNDVSHFVVGSISHNKMVMFNFSKEYAKGKRSRKMASFISGAEGALHDTFGLKAEELAKLMNRYRAFYAIEKQQNQKKE